MEKVKVHIAVLWIFFAVVMSASSLLYIWEPGALQWVMSKGQTLSSGMAVVETLRIYLIPLIMSFRKKILVKDIYNPKKMHSLLVDEKEPIRIVINHFAEDPCLRGIFVINKEQKYKGVITRYDLLNWAKFKLGAGIESDAISIEEVDRYVRSTKAKEIISKYSYRAFVKPEDNIVAAIDLMLYEDLITVPVVDDQGRVLGDLKLSEILHEISKKKK